MAWKSCRDSITTEDALYRVKGRWRGGVPFLASGAGAFVCGGHLGFDALKPNRCPAWHAFLVRLPCLALEGKDEPIPPTLAEAWCDQLRALGYLLAKAFTTALIKVGLIGATSLL